LFRTLFGFWVSEYFNIENAQAAQTAPEYFFWTKGCFLTYALRRKERDFADLQISAWKSEGFRRTRQEAQRITAYAA
jgi:hypothetical protein